MLKPRNERPTFNPLSVAPTEKASILRPIEALPLVSAPKLVLPDLQHKVRALRASLERLDRAIDTEAAKKARGEGSWCELLALFLKFPNASTAPLAAETQRDPN